MRYGVVLRCGLRDDCIRRCYQGADFVTSASDF